MQQLQVIEIQGKRVLTTRQIAEAYMVKEVQISQNFKNNRERFIDGKHYISLSGDELKTFKNQFEKIEVVKNRTSHLYLWTEKGALLHAKSLNTDKAWEVYDYLVDFYFRSEEKPVAEKQVSKPTTNHEKQESCSTKKSIHKLPQASFLDIAPTFRELISILPIESLDEMEKVLRGDKTWAVTLAVVAVLTEKVKRQLV